jgi:hypothetical protein
MKINITGVHSDEGDIIKQKVIAVAPIFVTAISEYFKNKSYGDGEIEILYREFCLRDGYDGRLIYYSKKRKLIDCAIVANFESCLKMSVEEYGKYCAQLYLERSKQFEDLKILQFDNALYVKDLTVFFKEHNLI